MVHEVRAEMAATVLEVATTTGARIDPGETLAVLESMKMEIPVLAETGGRVVSVAVGPGSVVQGGDTLLALEPVTDHGP